MYIFTIIFNAEKQYLNGDCDHLPASKKEAMAHARSEVRIWNHYARYNNSLENKEELKLLPQRNPDCIVYNGLSTSDTTVFWNKEK